MTTWPASACSTSTGVSHRRRRCSPRSEPGGSRNELYVNLQDPSDPVGSAPVHSGDQIIVDKKTSFFKDVVVPTMSVLGSIASIALLIRRFNR